MCMHTQALLYPHPDGLVETFDARVQGMHPTFTLLKVLSCREGDGFLLLNGLGR